MKHKESTLNIIIYCFVYLQILERSSTHGLSAPAMASLKTVHLENIGFKLAVLTLLFRCTVI